MTIAAEGKSLILAVLFKLLSSSRYWKSFSTNACVELHMELREIKVFFTSEALRVRLSGIIEPGWSS